MDGMPTYDDLPASLADGAVWPGDPAYGGIASTYFRRGAPGIVLLPRTTEQVADAVRFAGRHRDVPLGIRSGGHGLSGRSTNDGGIVVDLRHLNRVDVLDPAARLVRIGPGARWREVAAALQPHGWALSSGDSGAVAVGGLATSGGIGLLARARGLTIDHLVAAQVVLADGSVVVADEHEHPELFWAVRGAGANFGVAVSFDFAVDEVEEVGLALLTHLVEDPATFLVAFGEAAASAPRDTTAVLLAGAGDRGPVAVTTAVVVEATSPQTILDRIQPFLGLGPLVQHRVVVMPYAGVMDIHAGGEQHGRREPVGRSGLLRTITPSLAAELAPLLRSPSVALFQVRSLGGATADVPAEATAFAHRGAQFQVNALGVRASELDEHWTRIRPYLDGVYLPFETDTGPARLADVYPPATLERLRRLKRELDPGNLFRDNFNVEPAAVAPVPAAHA